MSTFEAHLESPWFELVESGRKTLEGRYHVGKWRKFERGDFVKFTHAKDATRTIRCCITDVVFAADEPPAVFLKEPHVLEDAAPGMTYAEALAYYKAYEQRTLAKHGALPSFVFMRIELVR